MRAKLSSLLVVGGACLLATGCTMPNPDYQGGPGLSGECRLGTEVEERFQGFARPDKVDLLFVVSQTDDMRLFQYALAEALPGFLLDLEASGVDLRFAVQTADRSAAGELGAVISSVDDPSFAYCEENEVQVARSGPSDWARLAACNVIQGVDADRRLRPLEVIRTSYLDSPEALSEFRRADARQVVVIFSNEDDCSGLEDLRFANDGTVRDRCMWQQAEMFDVSALMREFQATTVVPEEFSLVTIAGPTTVVEYERAETVRPVCRSTPGSSYPSPRLKEAAGALGEQGLFLSSCVLDYHGHLAEISERLIKPAGMTVCVDELMAQEPLQLLARYGDEERTLDVGSDFVFLGPTEECENGAIELRRDGAVGLDELEVRYCAS